MDPEAEGETNTGGPTDPEPTKETKTETTTEPESTTESDPNKATIAVQGPDGKVYNVTPTEAQTLLQMGLSKHFDDLNPKETPDTEEMSDIEKLQKEFNDFKQQVQAKEQQMTTNQVLHQKIQQHNIEDKSLSELVSTLALAKHIINPRIDLSSHFDDSLKQLTQREKSITEKLNEKILANSKVRASLEGIARGEGGVPVLDSEKKWTADDVKSGASRQALAELLEATRTGE